jgi:hypothetical protein
MVVGKGMLDAACPGDVFAAPPMDYVLETSKLLASPRGVLHIVNNYTGDRMAFEMGQEMAEAGGCDHYMAGSEFGQRRRRSHGPDQYVRCLREDEGSAGQARRGPRPDPGECARRG